MQFFLILAGFLWPSVARAPIHANYNRREWSPYIAWLNYSRFSYSKSGNVKLSISNIGNICYPRWAEGLLVLGKHGVPYRFEVYAKADDWVKGNYDYTPQHRAGHRFARFIYEKKWNDIYLIIPSSIPL